jgi:hypothetical protein
MQYATENVKLCQADPNVLGISSGQAPRILWRKFGFDFSYRLCRAFGLEKVGLFDIEDPTSTSGLG